MKYLRYTHAAAMGYDTNRVYSLEELEKKFSLEEIKCFFTPDNFTFEETEIVETKKK